MSIRTTDSGKEAQATILARIAMDKCPGVHSVKPGVATVAFLMGRVSAANRKRFMTVKELKELLKDVPDDTVVLRSGSDHSFHTVSRHGGIIVDLAAYSRKYKSYSEYYDDETLDRDEVKVAAVLIE